MFSRLYLHLPWCASKCNYCAFFSSSAPTESDLEETVQLLQSELQLSANQLTAAKPFASIYFGGGTPSLLTPEQVALLLSSSKLLWGHTPDIEVTLEANPGSLSIQKLAGYIAAGVNRLSLGVQSFNEHTLALLGRKHRCYDAEQAIKWARATGFATIGIDLICGLPGQNADDWQNQLNRALAMDVDHISVYCLSIEPGTPFATIFPPENIDFPDDDLAAQMLEQADVSLCKAGYEHYELSNFAKPGKRSRHNCGYWQRDGYLGVGPSAHSFLLDGWGTRFCNPSNYKQWSDFIKSGKLPFMDKQRLSMLDARSETIFLGLRLADGVCLDQFEAVFGERLDQLWSGALEKLQKADLLHIKNKRLQLTARGMLLANRVFVEFV